MNKINWNEQYKIRLASSIEPMDKHDIIKVLLVRKLIRNAKRNKQWQKIYTEYDMNNGSHLIPDVYVDNVKDKSVICYEIQKELTPKYIREKTKQYAEYEIPFMNSPILIIIPLKECPDNIQEINKWLDKYMV